jgi:hypothetical protein
MTSYPKQLLTNWNVCRIVRIIAGVPVLIMGIQQHDWSVILFGAAFLALGLFSTQCCSNGACYTPYRQKDNAGKPVDFEEIKN